MKRPGLPLPEPLRASEIPSFTNFSVVTRLPDIARRALRENAYSPETELVILDLIVEIPRATIRPLHLPAQQAGDWNAWTHPYEGMNWLDVPWFFAEEYFYARILEASGYFAPGDGYQKDPYAHQKQLGLQSTQAASEALAGQVSEALASQSEKHAASLARLLLMDLWGNQNDLSMWPVTKQGEALSGGTAAAAQADARAHLLADDTPAVVRFLTGPDADISRVDFLLDNAGYELVADLALADFLLHAPLAQEVVLHAKAYPVFVSDALPADIRATLEFLCSGALPAATMAKRLLAALDQGRLRIQNDPFWTSPLAASEMPVALRREIQQAQLLISKGDANYRRLLGDRHWPWDVPFEQVVDYFVPAVLAIRTLKSEIGVGISPAVVPAQDPEWKINGRWGLLQFSPPHPQDINIEDSNR